MDGGAGWDGDPSEHWRVPVLVSLITLARHGRHCHGSCDSGERGVDAPGLLAAPQALGNAKTPLELCQGCPLPGSGWFLGQRVPTAPGSTGQQGPSCHPKAQGPLLWGWPGALRALPGAPTPRQG